MVNKSSQVKEVWSSQVYLLHKFYNVFAQSKYKQKKIVNPAKIVKKRKQV